MYVDRDMDINLFDAEKESFGRVCNAIYYKNKENILCFNNAEFADLQIIQQQNQINDFWDNLEQDAQVIKSSKVISYSKAIEDRA